MSKEKTTQALQKGFRLQSKDRTYEIVKVLGSGSFGITYLATAKVSIGNISATMKFAIKEHFMSASCYRGDDGAMVLSVPTATSDVVDSRADFITEANRLKKLCLKSRSIVSVNETFEANGTAYYVMEFLDGGSPSKCTEEEAVSIVKQVGDALNEIHNEHVLHLDLKPDNIVLKTNDRNETYPVLIDFGISKHFDTKGRPTSSLSAKGASPGYAPQEQYAGVNEFSPKYDIYALGAVLFYLCIGKNPPDAFKISPNQQELKKELAGKVSPNIEKAILNAMKPSAMERTSSIQQFCDDLMGIDFVPVLNISSAMLTFGKDKSERTVSVESNIGWSVYADKDWCKVSKSNDNIIITVTKNKETGSRSCNVFVNGTSHQISQVIRIKQEGTGTVVFTKTRAEREKRRKKILQVVGGSVLICSLIAGSVSLFKTDPEKESRKLSEAIVNDNVSVLKKFADKDSIRAFRPLISSLKFTDLEQAKYYASKYAKIDSIDYLIRMAEIFLKEEDYQNAKLYVDRYLMAYPDDSSIKALQSDLKNRLSQEHQEIAQSNDSSEEKVQPEDPTETTNDSKPETNDEKFARASNDFNLMLSLAKGNYARAYYPLAEMYYNRNNKENAKLWATKAVNANVNRKQAQTLLAKIEPQTPSNDDLFAQATSLEDYKALADKGYKKAYAPLAELYLKKHQYDSAHQWAVKAGSARVGLDQARRVIDILSSYGYYDGGEKPNF